MKKSRKKILLSSIAMLLVALVALGSATYAWFTLNKKVTADGIQVTAATAQGLQITGTNGDDSTGHANAGWVRDFTFARTAPTLQPVSIGYATASGNTTMQNTGYYPLEAEKDGKTNKTNSANIDTGTSDWQSIAISAASNIDSTYKETSKVGSANGRDYYSAYRVGVRSTNGNIPGVTMTLNYADATGNNKKAEDFIRVIVVDSSGNVVAGYDSAADAVTELQHTDASDDTSPMEVKTRAAQAAADTELTKANITVGTTAQYYDIFVWFEGQDQECDNDHQGAAGVVDIKFAY